MYTVRNRFDYILHSTACRAEALMVADIIPDACVWLEV